MIFHRTQLDGVILIEAEQLADERGWFGRIFDEAAYEAQGLPTRFVQWSASVSRRAGTLRGMHYQRTPHEEAKLIRCVTGAIYDVVADMRPGSPSAGRWQGFPLAAGTGQLLFLPPGVAHGFLTRADDTEVQYSMTTEFVPGAAHGFRYDDPAFGIGWPAAPASISDKDLGWPPLRGVSG